MKQRLVFFAFTSLFLACSARGIRPLGGYDSDYHRILQNNEVHKKYYGVERVDYQTSAVYLSDDLRKAYVEEYARRYQSSESEKQAMLENSLRDGQSYTEFVVIHYASDRRSSKLDPTAHVWEVRLENNAGLRIKPSSVIRLPGEKRVLEYFYPSINQWSYNFLMRFPKQSDTSSLALHLDSIDDNVTFHWKP